MIDAVVGALLPEKEDTYRFSGNLLLVFMYRLGLTLGGGRGDIVEAPHVGLLWSRINHGTRLRLVVFTLR